MAPRLDLAGQRFGRLVVLGLAARIAKDKKRYWWVRCDCGCEQMALGSDMKRGRSRSCGCLRAELAGARAAAPVPERGGVAFAEGAAS